MRILDTNIAGVRLIEAESIEDARGAFARIYCPIEFSRAGIPFTPTQVNISRNPTELTLRGMHYQEPPRAESKLVHVARGAIFDVAIDLRLSSPTFRRWVGFRLDTTTITGLFIPEGCAHGFLTLEPQTDVLYHMGRVFEPGWDRGIRWNDPAFGIGWPARPKVVSTRDASYPDFVE